MKRVALILVLTVLPACRGLDAAGPLGPPADPTQRRDVRIYAAVIRQLVTVDHTFGGGDPGFGTIYVLDRAVEGAGGADWTKESQREHLSLEVQEGIRASLTDLPPIEFVSDRDSVIGPLSEGNRVKDEGALVTLAPISQGDDRVEVGASLYIANLAGTWLTYVVERSGDDWRVSGTTGPVAVS